MNTDKKRTDQNVVAEPKNDTPSSSNEHPWKAWIGTLKRDALTEEWEREVERYRTKVDQRDAKGE